MEHRDAEVNHLSSVLQPIANGEPADAAIVTGPSGAGKTCTSQFVIERLREEILDVEAIYVNFWLNYPRFRALYPILDAHVKWVSTKTSSSTSNSTVLQTLPPATPVWLSEFSGWLQVMMIARTTSGSPTVSFSMCD